MVRMMEGGTSLSEHEVPLFVTLLQAHNSRDIMNYENVIREWVAKVQLIEQQISNNRSLQTLAGAQRRIPAANAGPPGQNDGVRQPPDPLNQYFPQQP